MRIRMRMGDADGDGSYLYVCRYVYVCICAYLMQCVMLSRLYSFVGRQYRTYLFTYRERERERRKYYYYYQQHKEHTLVGVFTIIWEIHYLSSSAPSLPTLSYANPPENSQRERKRGDLYSLSNCTASPSTLALCGYR